jgi:Sigma-70, region 4
MSRRQGSPNDPTSRIALGIEGIELLHSVLDTLSEHEAMVIAMRFGLTNGGPKTLDEIGQIYGLSRDSVRQIESLSMAKLQHRSRSTPLGVWDGEALVDIVSTPGAGLSRISTDSSTWCSQCHKVPLITRNETSEAGRTRKYCSNACRQAAYRTRQGVVD